MERQQPARSAGESETRMTGPIPTPDYLSTLKASVLTGREPLNNVEYQNRKMRQLHSPDALAYNQQQLQEMRLEGLVKPNQLGQAMLPRGGMADLDSNIFAKPTNQDYYRGGGFNGKHFLSEARYWPRYELEGLDLSSWNGIFVTAEIGMPYSRCSFVTTQDVLVFGLEMSVSGFAFKVLPKSGYLPAWVGEVSWEVDIVQTPQSGDGYVMQVMPYGTGDWSLTADTERAQSMRSDTVSHQRIMDEVLRDVLGFLYFRATRRIEVQPERGPISADVPAAKEGDIYRVVKVDLRNQQNTSTPKGGTHASPREHEREAHWRTYKSGKRIRIQAMTVNKGVSKGTVKKHYEMKEKE